MRAIPAAVLLLLALAPLAACGDATGLELSLASDTVTVAVPDAPSGEATAIDLVRTAPPFTLLRRPERVEDAEQWDFALRRSGGTLALRPYDPLSPALRGAGIAVATRDYDQLDRAPRGTGPYGTETIELTEGTTYVARSRQYGGGCANYAKFKVVDLDVAAGTVELAVTLNDRCEDDRLAED